MLSMVLNSADPEDRDDLLDDKYIDKMANLPQLELSQITDIEPVLYIYHDCDDGTEVSPFRACDARRKGLDRTRFGHIAVVFVDEQPFLTGCVELDNQADVHHFVGIAAQEPRDKRLSYKQLRYDLHKVLIKKYGRVIERTSKDRFVKTLGRYRFIYWDLNARVVDVSIISDNITHFERQIRVPYERKTILNTTMFEYIIGRTRLLPSPLYDLNGNMTDSSTWQLDHTNLHFGSYTTTMIEQMFVHGTVSMSDDAAANVLCIGLGAGFINSYLYKNYPRMNITVVEVDRGVMEMARDWFGMVNNTRHHVSVMDGAAFPEYQAKAGIKYDVILLDACNIKADLYHCPEEEFTDPYVSFYGIRKALKETGLLLIHVYFPVGDLGEYKSWVMTAYQIAFQDGDGECDFIRSLQDPEHIIVTCRLWHKAWDPANVPDYVYLYQEWRNYPDEMKTSYTWRLNLIANELLDNETQAVAMAARLF